MYVSPQSIESSSTNIDSLYSTHLAMLTDNTPPSNRVAAGSDTRAQDPDARMSQLDAYHARLDIYQAQLTAYHAQLTAYHGQLETSQGRLQAGEEQLATDVEMVRVWQRALLEQQIQLIAEAKR